MNLVGHRRTTPDSLSCKLLGLSIRSSMHQREVISPEFSLFAGKARESRASAALRPTLQGMCLMEAAEVGWTWSLGASCQLPVGPLCFLSIIHRDPRDQAMHPSHTQGDKQMLQSQDLSLSQLGPQSLRDPFPLSLCCSIINCH